MRKSLTFLIILLFPLFVAAHEGGVDFTVKAKALPGQSGYFLQQVGEWFSVNIFTLSTRQKQEKKLELASRRVAEIVALVQDSKSSPKALETAVQRYQGFLRDAGDMAEKIIILDGAEIGLAEKLEETTFVHEQVLSGLLPYVPVQLRGPVMESAATALIQNETIFKFMVKNYQGTDADIAKHQKILDRQMQGVSSMLDDLKRPDKQKLARIDALLQEAQKFQKAGLNIEAYDLVHKARILLLTMLPPR